MNRGELLVVYAMLAVASCLPAHDLLADPGPDASWPYRFADATNRWAELFFPYLPSRLMVALPKDDPILPATTAATRALYGAGARAPGRSGLAWCAFITTLLFVMLCINTILRKQWTDRERLTYPIIQLPLEMTAGANEGVCRRCSATASSGSASWWRARWTWSTASTSTTPGSRRS